MEIEEQITLSISDYRRLKRAENYLSNWACNVVACKTCGELNPKGYVCISCGDTCPTQYRNINDDYDARR